jgi:hypothetical protein
LDNIFDICPGLTKVNTINFWTDVGLHFRCQEVAHYLLVEVKRNFNVNVIWDTFVECHGKSTVDSHFGVLSNWMDTFAKHIRIDTIEELIFNLEYKVWQSNSNRSAKNKSIYKFFIYQQEKRPAVFKKLYIPKITNFYHFEANLKDDEESIVRIKVTSNTDYVEDETIYRKIKIIEKEEKRVTKYSSKFTEESSQSKVQKMGTNGGSYGPNTVRRLQFQASFVKKGSP